MRSKLLPCFMALCLLLTGCINDRPADDKVYPAERSGNEKHKIAVIDSQIDTPGIIPFMEEMPDNLEHNSSHIIVNISPDGQSVYYMTRPKDSLGIIRGSVVTGYKGLVIKGRDPYQMDLMRLDIETGKTELIDALIPVITQAKWNSSGDILALMGGNRLTLYNAENRKLIVPEELQYEQVSHFGWGPYGKKLFTEHPNLPNGSIIYVNSGSIVHKYENDEELYYKGRLDESHFYGTYLYRPSEAELKQGVQELPETVVIDEKGKMIKVVGQGLFHDSYGRSVLQLGQNHFGLYYTPDINHTENLIKLTEEYIYDARFIYDGQIAYIIKSPEAEKNKFLLCIADQKAKLIKEFEVTGNCLLLSPDGKKIFTKGEEDELIDLTSMSLKVLRFVSNNPEIQPIYEVIRGAVDSYCKFALSGEKDLEAVKKYFINTHKPEQWAYFDIRTYMNDREKMFSVGNTANYVIDILQQDLYISGDRASVTVGFAGSNSFGTGFNDSWVTELIKKDNHWYITGLSTFPDSYERKKVKQIVDSFAADKNNSELKNKKVSIGQIQFWQLSEPHLAMSPEHANYCKIYLNVKENEDEEIYKLVLHKKDDCWMVNSMSKDNLSWLF